MSIDIGLVLKVVSFGAVAVVCFILSPYFGREYGRKGLRPSLAWCIGFLLYGVLTLIDTYVDLTGAVSAGQVALLIALLLNVFTFAAFYYGTSLLFFSPGSFFREKMSVLFIVVYSVLSIYLVLTVPLEEGFREIVARSIQLTMMTPTFFVVALLFYQVSRRLSREDPRRTTVFYVATGWFFAFLNAVERGVMLGRSDILDASAHILLLLGFILILYGMILGKAARA